ncbi:hypothetical protein CEXT_341301, partial [Caerostris extrusa]
MSATSSNKRQTFLLPSITWEACLELKRWHPLPGSCSADPIGVILKKKKLWHDR